MQHHAAKDGSLRVVFGDTVVSFRIAADVTFGEVAQALDDFSLLRHGHPVAIDLTLGRRIKNKKIEIQY